MTTTASGIVDSCLVYVQKFFVFLFFSDPRDMITVS